MKPGQHPKLIQSTRQPARLAMIAIALLFAGGSFAQGAMPQADLRPTPSQAPATQQDDGRLTREEILALFQREARAAYQMNKQACDGLADEPKKICLAKARLQFDEDMRYAKKRADLGY